MKALVTSNQDIYLRDITDNEAKILWDEFTFEDPAVRARSVERTWQGKYRRFDLVNYKISRTFVGRLFHACRKHGLPIHIEDHRPKWKYTYIDSKLIDEDFLPGIKLEQYQIDAIKMGVKAECGIFRITTGGGKCLGVDTPVMMFDGTTKPVQDIQIGDLLMGDDSTPRTVLSTSRGREKLYRVDQIYGDPYVVNESHILSLIRTPRRNTETYIKTDISVTDYLASSKYTKHCLKGYKAAVDFAPRQIEIDPYILGLWLGDGISKDTSFCLHDTDSVEVVKELERYAESIGCVICRYDEPSKASTYAVRLYAGVHAPQDYVTFTRNPLRSGLKHYSLLGNKHIPEDYIYNSREVRLQLLAGLIDSDGTIHHNGYDINMKNKEIVDAACFIARSLGFRANVRMNSKGSQTGYRGIYWRLSISGHVDEIPVRVSYKKAKPRLIKKNPLVHGITLTDIGEGDYYGFEIDGNKRFLLGDFTVTHNTEVIAGLCKAINCPTIILADMTVVVAQIRDRLKLREVASELGMFFAGQKPNGESIVIGSIQSLVPPSHPGSKPVESGYKEKKAFNRAVATWEKRCKAFETRKKNYAMLIQYVKNAEMLIVDECDRSASQTYRDIIRKVYKGRRRYGFSGTPFDEAKPIANMHIEENFGYIIHNTDRREVESRGRIVPFKYRMLVYQDPQYDIHSKINIEDAINMFMTDNQRLHEMVIGLCKYHKGEKNMALVDRIPVGLAMLDKATSSGLNAKFIYGKTPTKDRDEAIALFAGGKLDLLIGGKIANRGLDIKGGIDNLIIVAGGKMKSDFLQKVGRALRVNERGFSYIYDFLFRCNKYLYTHGKSHLEAVVESGYDAEVNFGYATIAGKDFIDRNYTPPRKPKPTAAKSNQKSGLQQQLF